MVVILGFGCIPVCMILPSSALVEHGIDSFGDSLHSMGRSGCMAKHGEVVSGHVSWSCINHSCMTFGASYRDSVSAQWSENPASLKVNSFGICMSS
jgi:hypothetical protein